MVPYSALKLRDLATKLDVGSRHRSELDESANHQQAHFYGLRTVEHRGSHDRTMFREGKWRISRIADKLGIDPIAAAHEKIAINAAKYPVDKARSSSKKYDQL